MAATSACGEEQIAQFPFTRDGRTLAWVSYSGPSAKKLPENRRGEKMRPNKEVFSKLQAAGLVTEQQRRRLMKGDHV